MPPVQCTLYQKSPKSQSCEIVANVLQFMHKYAEENKFVIPVSDVNERVASETRVFKIFLKIIRKEILNFEANTPKNKAGPDLQISTTLTSLWCGECTNYLYMRRSHP
jgi:hypothetical protein